VRIGVRFAWVYAVLILLPFPFSLVAPSRAPVLWQRIAEAAGAWAGSVFGITAATDAYVGDAMVRYLFVAVAAIVALVVAVVWAQLDTSSRHDERLDAWLRSYLRFALGAVLVGYGGIKVIPSQFPAPGLDALYQPIGDASPMGLFWIVMGASYPYVLFTGLTEIATGVLLMFRRTAIAGAALACLLLTHVLVVNIGYDVPQKLYVAHLLAIAAYLLAPHVRRLAAVLLAPATGGNRLASALGSAFAAYLVVASLTNAAGNSRATGEAAARSPMRGVWLVEEFSTDAAVTAGRRWRQLVFDGPEWAGLQFDDGSYVRVRAEFDDDVTSVVLLLEGDRNEATKLAELTVARPGPDQCALTGTFAGRSVRARLRRVEGRTFLLNTRGFRWIGESEFIR
jgi:hypothetical protein